ncbi:hypothetical protein [Mangrovicoccus ximenensis]|uniref:hypothetical protein n=1 Tax=Mangrovicoccus ximenensis TaxID=1911570 RepID=UPI0011AEAE7B|nr:hypothetical protein [Mangrovicoccus ximenensis]
MAARSAGTCSRPGPDPACRIPGRSAGALPGASISGTGNYIRNATRSSGAALLPDLAVCNIDIAVNPASGRPVIISPTARPRAPPIAAPGGTGSTAIRSILNAVQTAARSAKAGAPGELAAGQSNSETELHDFATDGQHEVEVRIANSRGGSESSNTPRTETVAGRNPELIFSDLKVRAESRAAGSEIEIKAVTGDNGYSAGGAARGADQA